MFIPIVFSNWVYRVAGSSNDRLEAREQNESIGAGSGTRSMTLWMRFEAREHEKMNKNSGRM